MGRIPRDLALAAYARGIFPMAEAADDPEVMWVEPRRRGVFEIGGLHLSRSLRRRLRQGGYRIALNTDFEAVVRGCADRSETWINPPIHQMYREMHAEGMAHSVEVWSDAGVLMGGVLGLTQGAAFFGESMFSALPDGSKIALVHLMAGLVQSGFALFDTQFQNPHISSLGAQEISQAAYLERLGPALAGHAMLQLPKGDIHRIITEASARDGFRIG